MMQDKTSLYVDQVIWAIESWGEVPFIKVIQLDNDGFNDIKIDSSDIEKSLNFWVEMLAAHLKDNACALK